METIEFVKHFAELVKDLEGFPDDSLPWVKSEIKQNFPIEKQKAIDAVLEIAWNLRKKEKGTEKALEEAATSPKAK